MKNITLKQDMNHHSIIDSMISNLMKKKEHINFENNMDF